MFTAAFFVLVHSVTSAAIHRGALQLTLQVMAFVLFPLTAAAFDSGWFSLSSQAGAASGKDVAHGLGAVPSTVKVSVKAVDGANVDYVFNGWGVPQSSGYTIKEYGGLVYAYNENTVRLWAPSQATGHIISVTNGWGGGVNTQQSLVAQVRVEARLATDEIAPDFESAWTPMASHSPGVDSYKAFAHGLAEAPGRAVLQVRSPDGWVFDAMGSTFADDDIGLPMQYGGVVYTYDTTSVYAYAPTESNSEHELLGRAIWVGDGWAAGWAAMDSTTCDVRARAWRTARPTPRATRPWRRLVRGARQAPRRTSLRRTCTFERLPPSTRTSTACATPPPPLCSRAPT